MKFEYSAEEIKNLFDISNGQSSLCQPKFFLHSSTTDLPMDDRSGSTYVTLNSDYSLSVDATSILVDTEFKFYLKALTIGDVSAYIEFTMSFTAIVRENNEPYFLTVL